MIAVLADIHSNLHALEAVLDDMPDVSAVWVLGDTTGELPFPREALDRLNDLGSKIPLYEVAGNREQSLLEAKAGLRPDWWKGPQFRVLAWTADQLTQAHWESMKAQSTFLPLDGVPGGAALFHGSPEKARGKIRLQEHAITAAACVPHRWLACGHTHNARLFRVGGQIIINAGSVGIPLDGMAGAACYALLDETSEPSSMRSVAFRQVPYDVDAAVAALKKSELAALAPGVSRAIASELLTGRHHMMGLLEFCKAYAERELGAPIDDIPPALWAEAEALWDGREWIKGRLQ